MQDPQNQKLLKKLICSKLGIIKADAKSCEHLSVAIFLKNGDYVSKTSLMRFFNLLTPNSEKFSPFVTIALWNYVNSR